MNRPLPAGPPADRPEQWPVEETQDLYRDDWVVALRADQVRGPAPDHASMRRIVLEHPGAVIVLALDEDERALVLQQYRHPVGMRCLELPAGLRDVAGEDPQVTAARELAEEAQCEADQWVHLLSSLPSPGISAERMEIFLARGLRPADRGDFEPHHEEADMQVGWVPVEDLAAAVLAGRVTDGPLALAVLAYLRLRDQGALTPA